MWATIVSALRNHVEWWQWAQAAWDVGSVLASHPPEAMKTAQFLQRMWVQAVKKLGRLKGHVSPSAASFPFLPQPFLWEIGRGSLLTVIPFSSDLFVLLAALRNKL